MSRKIYAVIAMAMVASQAWGDPPTEYVYVTKPEDVPAAVNNCKNNCTIRLQTGVYGSYDFRNLNPASSKRITIDYTDSSFQMMRFAQSSNLTINGGTVITGNQWGQCWVIDGDTSIILQHNIALRCAAAGFIITRSHDIALLNWTSRDGSCDGVTVSGTDGYIVAGGVYRGYLPDPKGCHADGTQMWGMDGIPLRNGLVTNNDYYSTGVLLADGKSYGIQGVTAFNNNAPDNGPYTIENITVTNNRMYLNGSWCVAIFKATNVVAKDNRCVDEVPRAWNSNYGWNGSTGTIGPNYLNNVPQSYPTGKDVKPPPPIFIAGADQHQ